jgi:hypothetical protein
MRKRNKFSLSNYKLATMNQGELVPMGCTEVLPGDTMQLSTSALIRVSPLLAPVMHPCHVSIHHWFVPNRLVWDDWENFITGGEDGLDASTFPIIDVGGSGASVGSLFDYYGVPTGIANLDVNALPFRGYAHIYNEWYRDQDLQTALTIDTTDGPDTTTNTTLQKVNWRKDYFTGARPDTQKGSEVTLPLGSEAPIFGDNMDFDAVEDAGNYANVRDAQGGNLRSLSANGTYLFGANGNAGGTGELKADLTNATAATINQIREAFALQKYAEARQIYGSRYTEYLRYIGVNSSDARLQRPEYLGGGRQTIQFSEVLQTAGTTDGSATGVGDLKGHGIAAIKSNRFRKFFEEHGFIHTFMFVRPIAIYSQGLSKQMNRATKEDYYQKELANIGMEEILNQEVYAAHATPAGIFGYQPRYDEYRKGVNTIAGDFRANENLEHWHMAREFSADPALNSTFVTCNPTDRVYASTTEDQLYVMANHSIQARRLVVRSGMPGGL